MILGLSDICIDILDSRHIPAESKDGCIREKKSKLEDQFGQKYVFRETKFGNDKSQQINVGVGKWVSANSFNLQNLKIF